MNLADYEILSFDCYGTLIDWEAGISKELQHWASQNALQLTDEELLLAFSKYEAKFEESGPTDLYSTVLAKSLIALGEELNAPVTPSQAQSFGESVPDWPAFPDSAEALARLAKHYKLVILSNVHREGFAGSNKRLGVTFTAIITAQDVGSYKPSMRNFEVLADKVNELGVAKDKHLHVAQSLFHDHVPAKQFGLPTVWINRRHDNPGWGATPEPDMPVTPDAEYPSMKAFADAADKAFNKD